MTRCYACGCCMRCNHAYFTVKGRSFDILASIPFFSFVFLFFPVHIHLNDNNNMDEYTKTSVGSNDILLKNEATQNHEEEKPQLVEEPRLERTMGMFSGVIYIHTMLIK